MATHTGLRVRCRFFGRYDELIGAGEAVVDLHADATVADVVRIVRRTVPGAGVLPERPLVAVNRAHALYDRRIADGDEVALLPPLAGG